MMRATFLLSACCALILVASPARAADPFAGFRIPDHTWQSGTCGFGMGGNRGASATASSTSGNSSRYSALSASLNGDLLWGHDSEDLLQTLQLHFSAGPSRRTDSYRTEYLDVAEVRDNRSFTRSANAAGSLTGAWRVHPGSRPLAVDVTASVGGSNGHSYSRTDYLQEQPDSPTRTERRTEERYADDQSSADLRAGVGWGRVRDASALYDAHLIEQRLAEAGALARPLSPRARGLLAQLEYAAPRMADIHERPARFVWAEIERIAREDGALAPGGLDAYAVMRAAEGVAPSARPQRLSGTFVGCGATYQTSHESVRWDNAYTNRVYGDEISTLQTRDHNYSRQISDALWVGGWAEWHRALGWAWQLDAATRVMRPARDAHGVDFESSAAARWFIADRWRFTASADHERAWLPRHNHVSSQALDQWSTGWSLLLAYYVEDRTTVSFSVNDSQSSDRYSTYDHSYRSGYFSVGLTYRFMGDLDVPAL